MYEKEICNECGGKVEVGELCQFCGAAPEGFKNCRANPIHLGQYIKPEQEGSKDILKSGIGFDPSDPNSDSFWL